MTSWMCFISSGTSVKMESQPMRERTHTAGFGDWTLGKSWLYCTFYFSTFLFSMVNIKQLKLPHTFPHCLFQLFLPTPTASDNRSKQRGVHLKITANTLTFGCSRAQVCVPKVSSPPCSMKPQDSSTSMLFLLTDLIKDHKLLSAEIYEFNVFH